MSGLLGMPVRGKELPLFIIMPFEGQVSWFNGRFNEMLDDC